MRAYIQVKTAKSYHTNSIFWLNKTAFQSKADHLRKGQIDTLFCSCDLDFDPTADGPDIWKWP